jgi:hypothetical protein
MGIIFFTTKKWVYLVFTLTLQWHIKPLFDPSQLIAIKNFMILNWSAEFFYVAYNASKHSVSFSSICFYPNLKNTFLISYEHITSYWSNSACQHLINPPKSNTIEKILLVNLYLVQLLILTFSTDESMQTEEEFTVNP